MTPQVSFFRHTIHGLSLTVFCSTVPVAFADRLSNALLSEVEHTPHLCSSHAETGGQGMSLTGSLTTAARSPFMASFASSTPALSQTQLSAYLEKINVPAQQRQPSLQTLCQIQKVLSGGNATSVEDRAGFRPAADTAPQERDATDSYPHGSARSPCRARHVTSTGTTWPCTIQK